MDTARQAQLDGGAVSTSHTDAASQRVAAEHSAATTLERFEGRSPELTAALRGMPREVVLGCMAMTFLEGVKYGADAMRQFARDALTD